MQQKIDQPADLICRVSPLQFMVVHKLLGICAS